MKGRESPNRTAAEEAKKNADSRFNNSVIESGSLREKQSDSLVIVRGSFEPRHFMTEIITL